MKRLVFLFVWALLALLFVSAPLFIFGAEALPVSAPLVQPPENLTTIITALASLVATLIAIWRNQAANNAQKVTRTLVQSVEALATLPQVRGTEHIVKAAIQARAELTGVEAQLAPLVERLTDGVPDDDEIGLRREVAALVRRKLEAMAAGEQQASAHAGSG